MTQAVPPAPGDSTLVHLRFKPLWRYVDSVREFCGFFTRATFDDRELGDRIALVVHELVENAIRYGDEEELELQVSRNDAAVSIAVANTATDDRVEQLRRVYEELMNLPPQESYLEALRRVPTLPEGRSGLGLPRVRFEANVDLTLDVTPGRVRLVAKGAL